MRLQLELATASDAPAIAALRAAAATVLTSQYGKGHWSATDFPLLAGPVLRYAIPCSLYLWTLKP